MSLAKELEWENVRIRHQLRQLGIQVRSATRSDDRNFLDELATDLGRCDSVEGLQCLWKRISFFLPRNRGKKRQAQLDIAKPLLEHFETLEAGTANCLVLFNGMPCEETQCPLS